MGEQEEDIFQSCIEEEYQRDFALGFCVEHIEAITINTRNEKQYVKIESDTTPIRKNINLRQISVYWEEQNTLPTHKIV